MGNKFEVYEWHVDPDDGINPRPFVSTVGFRFLYKGESLLGALSAAIRAKWRGVKYVKLDWH